MKHSYFFGGSIDANSVQDFMFFLNDCYKNPAGPPAIIDLYLRSDGGDLEAYYALKEAIETSAIPIHIKGVGIMASAAFMLFYFTENAIKSMSLPAYGLVHLITASHDDRGMRKEGSYDKVSKVHIDIMNEYFIEMYKKNKVLTPAQLKKVVSGEDITIAYGDLYKIMLKCPFGTFLKEGETIILEEK